MALATKERVSIPEHCVKVHKGDHVYIQYTVRAYRNSKGKPTSERVCIGKLDPETNMLIPNTRYYELFEKRQPISMPEYVRKCGCFFTLKGLAKSLGLYDLLKKHFPEYTDEILTVAQYMLLEGNVMYYLPDWQEESISFCGEILNGSRISRLFASIDGKKRLDFFNDWMKKKHTSEFLAYDVTSVSSYSKGIESLEWGYNRDKEKLPQLNMGMYYGESSLLPLYYRIYPGSIPDKAHLKYMAEDTDVLSSKKTKFVMDRGFYSADNLRYLTEKNCRFVIALPGSLKYLTELIEKKGLELINHSEYKLGAELPYGKAYDVTDLGFRMRVHLYYDPLKAANDSAALFRDVDKMEKELSEMDQPPDRRLHYDRFFFINVSSKDGTMSFRRKNELDMKRLHIHSEPAAEGKTFIAFIALILRSQMLKALSELMSKEGFTLRKIFSELDKAKLIISAASLSGSRLLNPPTRLQKDILAALGLPQDCFSSMLV